MKEVTRAFASKQMWLACEDADKMVNCLRRRKRLLVYAACLKPIYEAMSPLCRRVVDLVDRWADRDKVRNKLLAMRRDIDAEWDGVKGLEIDDPTRSVVVAVLQMLPWERRYMATSFCFNVELTKGLLAFAKDKTVLRHEWYEKFRKIHCDLIRDIVNPFFGKRRPDLHRLAREVAADVYRSGDFHLAPVLADCLEDHHPEIQEVIDHLRKPGVVRGWWSLDWLLGKK